MTELQSAPADDIGDILVAIAEFKAALPGWWFTLGSCSLTRDASCGPDRARHSDTPRDRATLVRFDAGFHCDDDTPGSTLADALRDVTRQAVEAQRDNAATTTNHGDPR